MKHRRSGRAIQMVVWLARIGVAAVFVVAATGKIADPAGFAEAVSNYRIFPRWSWNLIALVVPMIEGLGAFALVTGWKRRGAALLLAGLTLGFVAIIGSALIRGLDINCGCLGSSDENPLTWMDFAADIGLLFAVWVAGWSPPKPGDSSHISRASSGQNA